MKPQTNEFRKPKLTAIKGTMFKPTDPAIMAKTIGRPYERPTLVAPVFEVDLRTSHVDGIAYSQTVKKCTGGRFC